MAQYGGCLGELPTNQRRVLRLRAGVGALEPRSRQAVARVLDIRVGRVRRLERRGLRTVRTLGRTDSCGSGGTSPVLSGPEAAAGAGPVLAAAPAASGGSAERGGSSPDGVGAGGGDEGSSGGGGRDSGDVRGETSELTPPGFGDGHEDSTAGTSIWVALALILAAALAGFATPALRDRLRSPSRAT